MTSLDKIKERIDKLMALSESPEQEEASAAALLAVKLIQKHGFRVVAPEALRTEAEDIFDFLNRTSQRTETPVWTSRKRSRQKPKPEPFVIPAPRAGMCAACQDFYGANEDVWVLQGEGITHRRCTAYWVERGHDVVC